MFKFDFPYEENPHIEHNSRILQNFTNFLDWKRETLCTWKSGINSETNQCYDFVQFNKKEGIAINEEDYENKLKN